MLKLPVIIFLAIFLTAASAQAGQTSPSDAAMQLAQKTLEQQRESLVKQQESIRRQLSEPVNAGTIRIAGVDPFPPVIFSLYNLSSCPALERTSVDSIVGTAARRQSLSPDLIRAVIKQESAFHPCAISFQGAQGLMQLMPGTAQQFRVSDPFDPVQNVEAGAAFLKQLLGRYKGDLRLALAAYNAGPGRADQESSRPFPLETQNYVANIFAELGLNRNPISSESDAPSSAPEEVFPSVQP